MSLIIGCLGVLDGCTGLIDDKVASMRDSFFFCLRLNASRLGSSSLPVLFKDSLYHFLYASKSPSLSFGSKVICPMRSMLKPGISLFKYHPDMRLTYLNNDSVYSFSLKINLSLKILFSSLKLSIKHRVLPININKLSTSSLW